MSEAIAEKKNEAIEKKSRLDEIQLVANQGPQLRTMADVWTLAQMYWNAKMTPKGVTSPQQLLVILMAGAELGFGPTWALRNIASFNGQAVLHSDGPISLVMRSGLMEWQRSGYEGKKGTDSYSAWFEVKRKGVSDPVRREFSVGDAKAAGLWGKAGPWKLFPDRMLMVRPRSWALRDLFADVLGGIGVLEELVDATPAPGEAQVGSAGLLNALVGESEAEAEDAVDVEAAEWEPMDDEPTPEELEEIRRAELEEAGLFGGGNGDE